MEKSPLVGFFIPAATSKPLTVSLCCWSDGYVRKNIGNIAPVFRVKHFIRRRQARFGNGPDLHFPHSNEAGKEIGFLFRVRLMDNTFITFPGGPGFICINSGDEDKLVLYLFVYLGKAGDVVAYGLFIIGGTWADNHKEFIAFACEHIPDFFIAPFPKPGQFFRQRIFLTDFVRCGKSFYEFKRHVCYLL